MPTTVKTRRGEGQPTGRELEILHYVAAGLCSRAIAATLHLSYRTVGFHLFNLYERLGVNSRIQAVNLARQRGLLDEADVAKIAKAAGMAHEPAVARSRVIWDE